MNEEIFFYEIFPWCTQEFSRDEIELPLCLHDCFPRTTRPFYPGEFEFFDNQNPSYRRRLGVDRFFLVQITLSKSYLALLRAKFPNIWIVRSKIIAYYMHIPNLLTRPIRKPYRSFLCYIHYEHKQSQTLYFLAKMGWSSVKSMTKKAKRRITQKCPCCRDK